MKIPKQVKIGGHIIKVVLKEMDNAGLSDYEKGEISINSKNPQTQIESTLIHEAMHFMNANMADGVEHLLLESLSQQIYQFLKDSNLLK